ncbi:DUF29 domain-containing protein [Floridanema evergladense]|uniref:DUF29 domain-containing protein n=1 Tax=Floridaenema evergladense BLCC-F167 TaxID=3153639 RepID=A0ABV4WKD1_9CYAN
MMQTETKVSLYEQDFALWIEDVAAKLKARDFDNLDVDNLLEEIEALGKSQKRELKSRLQTLLAHILKRIYVDSPLDYNGWERTIREQRKELRLLFEQSPSLRNYYIEVFAGVWEAALSEVQQEYKKTDFPEQWQFSSDADVLLSKKYWEEQ